MSSSGDCCRDSRPSSISNDYYTCTHGRTTVTVFVRIPDSFFFGVRLTITLVHNTAAHRENHTTEKSTARALIIRIAMPSPSVKSPTPSLMTAATGTTPKTGGDHKKTMGHHQLQQISIDEEVCLSPPIDRSFCIIKPLYTMIHGPYNNRFLSKTNCNLLYILCVHI